MENELADELFTESDFKKTKIDSDDKIDHTKGLNSETIHNIADFLGVKVDKRSTLIPRDLEWLEQRNIHSRRLKIAAHMLDNCYRKEPLEWDAFITTFNIKESDNLVELKDRFDKANIFKNRNNLRNIKK